MTMIKYECEPCGYIYDSAVGDPDAGINPETAFEDIPDEGPTDRFSELVQKNVIDWLFGHIKTYDRSVAKFIFMKQNPDRC